MITCSNCKKQNHTGAKFCQNCGHSLKIQCTNCQVLNDPDANFCKNCGHPLSPELEMSALQQEQITPIETSQSERRFITILFCDIVGSTAIGERLDPEEWTEIMNGVFGRLIPEITRYGGTTARLLGDAVLALFGAPVAHEDDPYRAVLAAQAMLENFRPYQEQVRNRLQVAGLALKPTDFNVRIGINTGLAIVGNVGSGEKQEYTAMGDAVNLAARMEQTADPGTIQIAHDTYSAVKSMVELEPLDPVMVKGKEEPVRAYQVLGLKAPTDRKQVSGGMKSSLVGRRQEINQLTTTFSKLSAGRGGIICVLGEGGIGKSRLVEELHKRSQDAHPGINWIKAESFSFEGSQPYGLIQRLLRRVGDITREDSQEVTGSKITAMLKSLTAQQQMQYEDVFKMFFGLERSSEQSLQGEDFKRELFAAMRLLAWEWAAARPTVMVFEDLHWTDAASVELINHFLSLVDEVPLLMICIFRPYTRSAAWMIKQQAESTLPHRYQEIMLKPLTAKASISLISNLLNISEIPVKIEALLEEKVSGVPYFIEEVVRDLQESGILTTADDEQRWQATLDIEDIHVPETLEAVLVSRMDRLEVGTRHTMQLAAVIGRTFNYRVLQTIAANKDLLDYHLRQLQQAGMINETKRIPEPEYTFRHVLTQEAAYNTILRSQRLLYHRQVAEAIAQIFSDNLNEQASLLALHFHHAGEDARALPYYEIAAESAAHLYANEEALALYKTAIEIANKLVQDDSPLTKRQDYQEPLDSVLSRLNESLGDLLMLLGDYPAARDVLSLSLATLAKDRSLYQARLHEKIGSCWSSQMHLQEASSALYVAEEILETAPQPRTGAWYKIWLEVKLSQADALYFEQRFEEMALLCNSLKEPVKRYGSVYQRSTYYSLLVMLNNGQLRFAPTPESAGYARQALELVEPVASKKLIAQKGFILGFQLLLVGRFEEAVETLSRSWTLAKEIGSLSTQNRSVTYLLVSYRRLGDEAGVRNYVEEAKTSTKEEQIFSYTGATHANSAWLAYRSGDLEEARLEAMAALECWGDFIFPFKWLALLILIDLALKQDELETAVDHAAPLLETSQQRLPDPINDLLQSTIELWAEQAPQPIVEASLSQAVTLAKEHGYL